MPRRAPVVAVIVLTLVAPAARLAAQPVALPPSATPRLWTQVHGRVVAIQGTQLTLRMDDGVRLRVDISAMSPDERRDLAPGVPTTLIGYVSDRPYEFVAWFVPLAESEMPPAASPAASAPEPPHISSQPSR